MYIIIYVYISYLKKINNDGNQKISIAFNFELILAIIKE